MTSLQGVWRCLYNRGERRVGAGYEVCFYDDRFPGLAAYGFPCADVEMDAEPVSVRAGTAHAVYFRLRSLYAVLPGVAAIFDFAGGRVWMLPALHRRNGHSGSCRMVQRLDC